MKHQKEEMIGGHFIDIDFDDKIKVLNLELVKVFLNKDDKEGHYEIHFQDWSKENKSKTFLRLHVLEAVNYHALNQK